MIYADDFQNAFGQADDGFKNNVYRTITKLQNDEDSMPVRRISMRLAIVAAVIICLAITGTALALTNAWGLLDYLSNRNINVEILPEATDIIQNDIQQKGGHSEKVDFSVREAIFDGQSIYVVVEAKPSTPEYLLLERCIEDTSAPVSDMGSIFSEIPGSISDYLEEHSKTPLCVWVSMEYEEAMECVVEDDGTIVCITSGRYDGSGIDALTLELKCMVVPYTEQNGKDTIDMENSQDVPMTITLKNTGTIGTVSNTEPIFYSDCGIRVDRVTLTGTAMATYVEIEYTVIDASMFYDTYGGVWFEFVDKNGDRLPRGANHSGSRGPVDGSDTRYLVIDSIRPTATMPNEVTMRVYNAVEDIVYGTHTFEVR